MVEEKSTPAAGAGRGRGRGRGRIAVQAVGTPAPGPSNRVLGSGTTPSAPSTGLLGASDYARLPPGPNPNPNKTKFVPNAKRKGRLPEIQAVVKQEEGEAKPRPMRGAGRGRAPVNMTASGPMGQGPVGQSKNYSARSSAPEGQGVMSRSASNSFGGRGSNSADQFVDADESDFETPGLGSDDGGDSDGAYGGSRDRVFKAKDLAAIGMAEEMAPITLQKDPKEVREGMERRRKRSERRIKGEAKPEDEDDKSTLASATATPAPDYDGDSKMGSVDSKLLLGADSDRKIDFKPEPEMEDLTADFDVDDPSDEKLYIFQFPRKFPELIAALDPPVSPSTSSDEADTKTDSKPKSKSKGKGKPTASDLEDEDDKPLLEKKKKIPPIWGRTGSRGARGARWSREQGAIGELIIRKSGRVTLVVNGDMEFEVLPAAQPSFLQEVVILDHDPALIPRPPGTLLFPTKPAESSSPTRSILTMGQTGKKFIVVPEVKHLLGCIEKQEKEEKREKEKLKAALLAKKEEA